MKKSVSIDYLRALSMLYIVGFWHLFNYTNAFPEYKNAITFQLTNILLGLFVFISGYLASGKNKGTIRVIDYYKKRLFRIYPLYILAIILFYLYELNSGIVSLKAIFSISMFNTPAPLTLWFITMLIIFYLITPVLLKIIHKPLHYSLVIISVLLGIIALHIIFKSIDLRILLYFPCFFLGLHCSLYGLNNNITKLKIILPLLIAALLILFLDMNSWTLNQIKEIPIILTSSYLIFFVFFINDTKFKENKLISFLSYSSFTMYLFHRPVYISLKAIYFPSTEIYQVIYLMFFCLPVVAFTSWVIQKTYDNIYMKLVAKA